jgi:hypothetical protein
MMGTHATRRGYFLSSLGGAVLGAVLTAMLLMSVLPVEAATGDDLVLGRANRAAKSTRLASRGPSVMKLTNTAGGALLDLRNGGAAAPMLVDSNRRVFRFNADEVDGRDANELIRVAYDATTDATDGNGAIATATIDVPRRGLLVMSGTVDASGTPPSYDLYTCRLTVDGNVVAGTEMHSIIHGFSGHTANNSENCATTGVHPVAAGSRQVTLEIAYWNGAVLNDASLWAMYVPFGHTGSPPAVP